MFRTLLCASLLGCLVTTACKGKEKTPEPATNAAKNAATNAAKANDAAGTSAPAVETPDLPPVEPDIALIDATLEKLGDATLAAAGSKGLPSPTGELGISCGGEKTVVDALKQIDFASDTLKGGKGFLFQDVCIGWRPYITPVTEIYWMISAGAPVEGEELMPVRRCLQVISAEGTFKKESIIDGPCLTMHRQQ